MKALRWGVIMAGRPAYPIENLVEGGTGAGVVVSEEPPGQVREALLDNCIGWVHTQSDAFNHAESSQDEGEVGGDLEGKAHGQIVQLGCHLQLPSNHQLAAHLSCQANNPQIEVCSEE